MAFTGRLGIPDSQLGNIVLGIVDSFELSSVGFRAHQIGPKEIRLLFDHAVSDSALNTSAYVIAAITPSLAYVPIIVDVRFDDSDQFSVIISFQDRFFYSGVYSIQANGVVDLFGNGVSGTAYNFTINVQDNPKAVKAFLSKRGAVDIKFDRSVGSYSSSPSAYIVDADDSSLSALMVNTVWASEGIPEDTLRFIYPVTTPTALGFNISFLNVIDISGNVSSGVIPLTIAPRSTGPYNSSSLSQLQFTESSTLDVSRDLAIATIRLYFNGPVLNSSVTNTSSWNITQSGPHKNGDTVNTILVIDCFDLASCKTLLNSIKAKFNLHIIQDAVHVQNSLSFMISTVDLTGGDSQTTTENFYNSALSSIRNHLSSFLVHSYDDILDIPNTVQGNLSNLISYTNLLKSKFNNHLLNDKTLSFSSLIPPEIGVITNKASNSSSFIIDSDESYFVDLYVRTHTAIPDIRIRGTIISEDGGSSTSTLNSSGDITSNKSLSQAVILSDCVFPDDEIIIDFNKEILNFGQNLNVVLPSSSDAFILEIENSGSLKYAVRIYNYLVFSYYYHINVSLGAGHIVPETSAFVSSGDYYTGTNLSGLISSVNSFRIKLSMHLLNISAHTNVLNFKQFEEASDLESVLKLMTRMIQEFVFHNRSGFAQNTNYNPSIQQKNLGIHNYPGPNVLNVGPNNRVTVRFKGMKDGISHNVVGMIKDHKWDPYNQIDKSDLVSINYQFIGNAYRPSLASALPSIALSRVENGTFDGTYNFSSDIIDVWFSKPMLMTDLSSLIILSGGTATVDLKEWNSNRRVSLHVSSMENISYNLNAVSLYDEAGNPIY